MATMATCYGLQACLIQVLTPDVDGISVAGSGGYYAKAAALAFLEGCPDMPAGEDHFFAHFFLFNV